MDIKTLQTQILSALQQGDIMLANNLMDKILPSMAPTMDEALTISIVGAITGHATTSIAIKAQTIGHFLSVAHDNVPEQAIASAMKDFSQAAKFDGVFNEDAILEAYHAIIYNISDEYAVRFGGAHPQELADSLRMITVVPGYARFEAPYSEFISALDKAGLMAGQFLEKFPDLVPHETVAYAMKIFSQNKSLTGVEVILDNISYEYAKGMSADPDLRNGIGSDDYLGEVFQQLIYLTGYDPDRAQGLEVVGKFLDKMQDEIPSQYYFDGIGSLYVHFQSSEVIDFLECFLDHISDENYMGMIQWAEGRSYFTAGDGIFNAITNVLDDGPWAGTDKNAALRLLFKFLDRFGDEVSSSAYEEFFYRFSRDAEFFEDILDHIPAGVLNSGPWYNTDVNKAFGYMTQNVTYDADQANRADQVIDFMHKFGHLVSDDFVANAVKFMGDAHIYEGVDALIAHSAQVSAAVKAQLVALDAADPNTDVKIMTAGNDTSLTFSATKVDVIYGMEGDDYIGTRNDTSNNFLFGDAGNDRLGGGHGNDYISGGIGNDQLYGGAGNDKLLGGRGDDTLLGENGNDSLDGGEGADKLYGQAGADTFVLDTIGKGVDTIADFSKAQGDKIDISDVLDRYDPLDDAIADFVKVTKVGAGTSISIDADGAGADNQAVEVAKLTGVVFNNVQEMLDAGVLITV